MFVGGDTATLAMVDSVDGSVFVVLSRSLAGQDAATVVAGMVTSLQASEPAAEGLCVVGSGVDVSAVTARLQALVAVPVVAPEKPQLALARGAALASAHAPRYDTSTIGLAYSQDPGDTVIHRAAYPIALASDATTLLGHEEASFGAADTASERGDAPQLSKPLLIMGSSLTAVFVVGVTALAIAMAISFQPSQDGTTLHPGGVVQSPASEGAPPAATPNRAPHRSLTPRRRRHHLRRPSPRWHGSRSPPSRRQWWCATQCPHRTPRPPRPRRPRQSPCRPSYFGLWSPGYFQFFSRPTSSTRLDRRLATAAAGVTAAHGVATVTSAGNR